MSFEGYLNGIRAKTGQEPEDIVAAVRHKGLAEAPVRANDVVAWLADEYGLGRGHAMAIVALIKEQSDPTPQAEDRIAQLFSGPRARWRPAFDRLVGHVRTVNGNVELDPTKKYVSMTISGRKFAIVAPTASRLDVGVKLASAEPSSRLEPAGTWNSMVTHRVRVTDMFEIDTELLAWLTQATNQTTRELRLDASDDSRDHANAKGRP